MVVVQWQIGQPKRELMNDELKKKVFIHINASFWILQIRKKEESMSKREINGL